MVKEQLDIERYHKWGRTLSFGVENLLTWGPDQVFKREIPDRNTQIVWNVAFLLSGEGEDRNLTLKFNYKYPDDEIESIDFQFSAILVSQADPGSPTDGARHTLMRNWSIENHWSLAYILDPANHYFIDGRVNVDIDFCIHSILYSDGLRKFDFHGKPLNWKAKRNFVGLYNDKHDDCLTICYEIAAFHSPVFAKFSDTNRLGIHDFANPLEQCLQIMHGVRLKIQPDNIMGMLNVALQFRMRNVIRYIETYSILADLHDHTISAGNMSFFNLRRLMKTRMRSWNFRSVAALKQSIERCDLDDKWVATGELMKSWMAIFMRLPNE